MDPETLGIAQLNSLLKQAELDLDAQQIADILWLAVQICEVEETSLKETPIESKFGAGFQDTSSNFWDDIDFISHKDPKTATDTKIKTPPDSKLTPPIKSTSHPPAASAYLPYSPNNQLPKKTVSESIPFQAPAAPALRQPLALARALRPLMRKVPSPTQTVIDEEETVTQIVEKGIWTPVLKPAPERWLELALVVEESRSTVIWQEIIADFQKLTELQGAFRDVRTWGLKTDHNGVIKLFPKGNFSAKKQRSRSFKELLDPTGRRLIVLISDCISPIWRQNEIYQLLKHWSNDGPVAILQLLPERIWGRTALGAGFPIQLSALVPGVANSQLVVDGLPVWEEVNLANALNLPVVTLEADSLKQWSRVVAGLGNTQTAGILWELSLLPQASATVQEQLSAVDLVKQFRTTASPTARRLAGLMATVPVSLPVVYLIQETLLPESRQAHIAEVFMSGLLQPQSDVRDVGAKHLRDNSSQKPKVYNPNALPSDGWETNPKTIVQYEFVEGVRDLLVDSVPIPDVDAVLETVSQYIAHRIGLSINNFAALLSPYAKWEQATEREVKPFARIASQVLHRLGGEYAALAEQLEHQFSDASTPGIELEPFNFDVATIELKRIGRSRGNKELIIKHHNQQAYCFTEDLGNGVELEIVAIPEGSFLMGSPKDETERHISESPQHRVTVQSFLIGKYPVTQAQWQAVASLPLVNTELKPNPYHFKGEDRPVEQVSWYDAVEFCDRLSQKTGRQYRLPSEAEWEYACRAGTTTPFHFGETITPELANYDYDSDYIYGSSAKGKFRSSTTPVGNFKVANEFGLYDMHGNVWEWCADHWHENYEGAPTDGIAWEDKHKNDYRLMRSGSWGNVPGRCRSACRNYFNPSDSHVNAIGFRVVCEARLTRSSKEEMQQQVLGNWHKKRLNYQYELSRIISADEKFALYKKILECQEEIQRLEKTIRSTNNSTRLIIKRHQRQVPYFVEDLGNGIVLDMIVIPGGTFLMGSPETEEGHIDSESPQHQVTLKSFLMGIYPVTQAQWQAVSALPPVNRTLDSNPSYLTGTSQPVERVSWYDAVEFCDRLSQKTGRQYRLPSESEWEYACRAGTTTPFHFGKTITTDLANYDGNYTYGNGARGKYRQKTTPVGSLDVVNYFGLYDMHGNVWEWCADYWHDNYEGAPTDGSVWSDDNDNKNSYRLLRGGSWITEPALCRSAYRSYYYPSYSHADTFGFRVVCEAEAAWTL